tara:strand:+ start:670 stop:801 length:132 start_codon:yes stop_codon:yes gene_type:complete
MIYTHKTRENNLVNAYPLSGSFQKILKIIGKIRIPRNSMNNNE